MLKILYNEGLNGIKNLLDSPDKYSNLTLLNFGKIQKCIVLETLLLYQSHNEIKQKSKVLGIQLDAYKENENSTRFFLRNIKELVGFLIF